MPAGPRRVRGDQLAAQLVTAGVRATTDVQKLDGLLPAVLVGPPRLSFDVGDGATATWRLLAVASTADSLTAWDQLDQIVTATADLLPVQDCEPTSFAATPGVDPLPAYALTLTEYVD